MSLQNKKQAPQKKAQPKKNNTIIKKAPKFKIDPNMNYNWEPDSDWKFSGVEFDTMLKALVDFRNTPDVQRTMRMVNLSYIMEDKFRQGVEDGTVKVTPKE